MTEDGRLTAEQERRSRQETRIIDAVGLGTPLLLAAGVVYLVWFH